MSKRSTRDVIKDKAEHITWELDKCLLYLYEISQLAQGGSPWITSQSPFLGTGLAELKKAVKLFRSGL